MTLASHFSASLPAWLVDELGDLPNRLDDDDASMQLVNRLADRNWRAGNGGPFAAIVVNHTTRELISVGVNVVLSSGLSSMHAEVTALSLAQVATAGWDLGADRELELVVNWRPCAMCYGAVLWSGVRHLVIAGEGPECEDLTGFDEGPVTPDWRGELELRGIRVTSDVRRAEAVSVYAEYGRSDSIVYNARGDGASAT